MAERTALGEAILRHWREHRPEMVAELSRTGLLSEAVETAQVMAGDLLYEMVSVKKMDYQQAWEMAVEQWALPETMSPRRPPTSSSRRSRKSRPRRGISG
ncbi:MAG: hypothetical protein JNL62_22920 [Bryobacterales bacterium]|nr:hypothetical protein [Bryobacterales bacterium]